MHNTEDQAKITLFTLETSGLHGEMKSVYFGATRDRDFFTTGFMRSRNLPYYSGAIRPDVKPNAEKDIGGTEAAILPDTRLRIVDTRAYPYSAIVALSIENRNGQCFSGTGVLIGPRLVLTARHNVFYYGDGFMRSIT